MEEKKKEKMPLCQCWGDWCSVGGEGATLMPRGWGGRDWYLAEGGGFSYVGWVEAIVPSGKWGNKSVQWAVS